MALDFNSVIITVLHCILFGSFFFKTGLSATENTQVFTLVISDEDQIFWQEASHQPLSRDI